MRGGVLKWKDQAVHQIEVKKPLNRANHLADPKAGGCGDGGAITFLEVFQYITYVNLVGNDPSTLFCPSVPGSNSYSYS